MERYERNKQLFQIILPNGNFTTTRILDFIKSGPYVCELAKCNFLTVTLYGVTVVNTETQKHKIDLGQTFKEVDSAHAYIKSLN